MNYRVRTGLFLAASILMVFPAASPAGAQAIIAKNLEETSWVGTDSSGSAFVFEFHKAGIFRYVPTTGVVSKGRWKLFGNSIKVEINGGFVKFSGAIDSEQMKGQAVSRKGLKWTWVAMKQPSVVSNSAPRYPPIAFATGAKGDVIVEVNLTPEGVVTAAHALSGHVLLRKASEDAARLWKFSPDMSGDKNRTARIIFLFRILTSERDENKVISPVFLSPYQAEIRRIPHVDYTTPSHTMVGLSH